MSDYERLCREFTTPTFLLGLEALVLFGCFVSRQSARPPLSPNLAGMGRSVFASRPAPQTWAPAAPASAPAAAPAAPAVPERSAAEIAAAAEAAAVAAVKDAPPEAAAAGISLDAAGLSRAARRGLRSTLAWKITDYPRVVKFVLDSRVLNDALFATPWVQRACADPAFLQAYLSSGSDAGGVASEVANLRALLQKPDSARATANTEFSRRAFQCSSVRSLANDPRAVTAIADANPELLFFLRDPGALEVMASDAGVNDALMSVQQALGARAALGGAKFRLTSASR